MTNRISTAGMANVALEQMMKQQLALAKTQSQVTSGKRVQSPSDDPVAATQIMTMQAAISQITQYKSNADAATARLNLGEQGLNSAVNLLQHVRDLVVQANTSTVDPASQQAIATEVKSSLQQLMGIANQQDSNGEYLFAGLATTTQPFVMDGSGAVSYQGDAGTRYIQLSQGQKVQDGFSGSQVFMDVQQGNGYFTTAAATTNTGTAAIDPGKMVDATQWQKGTYSLKFTSATDYQIVDTGNNVLASGTYTDGSAISFKGAQVTLTGTPAAGDSFTLAPAGTEDVFTTLNKVITQLSSPTATQSGRAAQNTGLMAALGQIDQALDQVSNLRTQVGARLNLVDSATSAGQQLSDTLTSQVSQAQDLDYAQAVTAMNQQLIGLQAAQSAYAKISQLSLFNYL